MFNLLGRITPGLSEVHYDLHSDGRVDEQPLDAAAESEAEGEVPPDTTARAIALVREALEAGGDDWDRNIRRLEHVLRLLEEELGDVPMVATNKASSPQHVEQGIGSQRRLVRRVDDFFETTGGVVKRFSFAHMPRADALSELKREKMQLRKAAVELFSSFHDEL